MSEPWVWQPVYVGGKSSLAVTVAETLNSVASDEQYLSAWQC